MGGARESISATTPTRGSRAQHFASPSKLRVSMAQGYDDADAGAAKLAYSSTFTGLQSYGPSGMTVLDELTDMALTACEKGREAGQRHHARGAALLSQTGKIYTGCDVHVKDTGAGSSGVSAERACVLAAIADGESVFHCLVIASDTMKSFPTPDGQSREFLRSFGAFSVVLVNCVMENKQTSTQELFPLNAVPERPPTLTSSSSAGGGSSGSNVDDEDDEAALDVISWDVERVKSWLADIGMPEVQAAFLAHKVDGRLLLQVDETFATETLDIHQAVRRRKLVRNVQRLKAAYTKDLQRRSIDELDDYVLMLESHRITLVAKLKAIFDRFDSEK
jgi:cytidine deaminase